MKKVKTKRLLIFVTMVSFAVSCKTIKTSTEYSSAIVKLPPFKSILDSLNALDTSRVSVDSLNIFPTENLCEGIPVPTLLKQLNQNDIFTSNVSLSRNASLSLYGFSGTMGKKDILVSAYLIKFKDYKCGNETKRAMVGIRLYVHASDLKIKLSSPSIANVAAAVELGLAKSEYRFRTFGLNPTDFYPSLPSALFNVDTYSKVIDSYDKIIHSLKDSTSIDPLIEDVIH